MLELIVFTCGASLMGLEFVAARMLAPSLGSSLFVWGSVVSIVMVALSVGYWLGGQIADRLGSTRTLAPVIAAAGTFTVVIPGLTGIVLPMVTGLGARSGSLVASAIVFFVPSLLLAMVSPIGVRLATGGEIEHIGRSAGQLYAISTAGSILGTIATAFWLIPLLSLDGLVIGIGLLLFVAAAVSLALPQRYEDPGHEATRVEGDGLGVDEALAARARSITIACIVVGLLAAAISYIRPVVDPRTLSSGEREIYRADTQYHRLFVTEDSEQRRLRFDRSNQSAMYLDDPFESSIAYIRYLHLALALKPDARRVLIVGLGGGTLPKRMWRDYPEMQIDVAEIDPVVVDVAHKYFGLPKDRRIRVTAEDGRRFLASSDARYDIIVLDAYYSDSLPFHLTTQEFFRSVDEHLAPGGVVAYNVIGSVEGDRSKLFRSIYRTAHTVWKGMWVFPIGIGSDHVRESNRNIIMLATDAPVTEQGLRARISNRVSGRVTIDGFNEFASDLYTEPVNTRDVPLLTDEHAPTDSLIKVN